MQINCGYLSATWDNSPTFIMTSVPHLPGQGSKGTQGTHVWDLEATARLLRLVPGTRWPCHQGFGAQRIHGIYPSDVVDF